MHVADLSADGRVDAYLLDKDVCACVCVCTRARARARARDPEGATASFGGGYDDACRLVAVAAAHHAALCLRARAAGPEMALSEAVMI